MTLQDHTHFSCQMPSAVATVPAATACMHATSSVSVVRKVVCAVVMGAAQHNGWQQGRAVRERGVKGEREVCRGRD